MFNSVIAFLARIISIFICITAWRRGAKWRLLPLLIAGLMIGGFAEIGVIIRLKYGESASNPISSLSSLIGFLCELLIEGVCFIKYMWGTRGHAANP